MAQRAFRQVPPVFIRTHSFDDNRLYTLVSCDPSYLRVHFPALLASANESENSIHLHIVNPILNDIAFANQLAKKAVSIDVVISIENDSPKDRVYYACNRFLIAEWLLDKGIYRHLLISDVDALLLRKIEIPTDEFDVGIFLRDPIEGTVGWEKEGTKIAAGAVFYNTAGPNPSNAKCFALTVANEIQRDTNPQWFLDQVALNRAYKMYEHDLKFKIFDSNFLDWEPGASQRTTIFSGKGDRKYNMAEYVTKKKWYEEMFL